MKEQTIFWVIGGDLRHHWLARQLSREGYQVHSYGQDATFLAEDQVEVADSLADVHRAHCVILPLPFLKDGKLFAPFAPEALDAGEVLSALSPHQMICAGQATAEVEALAGQYGLTVADYFAREELMVANAVPTAEGCIQVAMERLATTIADTEVLILGYGRVGQATAKRFAALGARVTVAARRTGQLALAKAEGFATDHIEQLVGYLCCYTCVVNTVPQMVLGEAELLDLEPDTLIIDLASHPGGVNQPVAQALHRRVVTALSLPGKVAPATAGYAIMQTVLLMLAEQVAH